MTNSHRFNISPGFFRFLSCSSSFRSSSPEFSLFFFFFHHFLVSFSLFIFIDPRRSQTRDIRIDNARQCGNVRRSALLIETGDLPKYRVLSRLGRIVSDTRPGHAATVYFPGQVGVKNEAAKPIRVLLSSPLPPPPLKLG